MLRSIVFFLGLTAVAGGPAFAATASATIGVSATVVSTCSVSGGSVGFGAYASGSAAAQQAALTVNCSNGTAYSIALNDGASGDATARRMSGPNGAALTYDLYRDASHSQRWGSGADIATGVGTGAPQIVPLYAAIVAQEPAAAGTYSDTVTATLTY